MPLRGCARHEHRHAPHLAQNAKKGVRTSPKIHTTKQTTHPTQVPHQWGHGMYALGSIDLNQTRETTKCDYIKMALVAKPTRNIRENTQNCSERMSYPSAGYSRYCLIYIKQLRTTRTAHKNTPNLPAGRGNKLPTRAHGGSTVIPHSRTWS